MSTSFPFLQGWMDKTPQNHPLADLITEATRNNQASPQIDRRPC
ncbi:hypothetical protein [Streptomyces sp. NPDC097981]